MTSGETACEVMVIACLHDGSCWVADAQTRSIDLKSHAESSDHLHCVSILQQFMYSPGVMSKEPNSWKVRRSPPLGSSPKMGHTGQWLLKVLAGDKCRVHSLSQVSLLSEKQSYGSGRGGCLWGQHMCTAPQ